MHRLTFLEREIRRRPLRMILTLFSVALGVAGVVSIRIASLSARDVFQQMQDAVGGKFDLEVVAADGSRFDRALIESLSGLPSIQSVSPVLNRTTVVYGNGKRATATAQGIELDDQAMTDRIEIVQGRMIGQPDEVTSEFPPANPAESDDEEEELDDEEPSSSTRTEIIVDESFARMLEVGPGDGVSLLLARGPARSRVVGLFRLKSGIGTMAEATVILQLSDLQDASKSVGQIDQGRLVLAKGTDSKAASQEIAATLDNSLTVRTPVAKTELASATIRGVEYALGFAQSLMLVMAIFITLNTYMISIGERRRQWGILLAIGMTRRQLMTSLLGEAFVVGLVGAAIGLGLGIAGAHFLSRAIATMLETPPAELPSDPVAFVLAVLLGPTLTVIACFLPARTACQIPPVEAMRGEEPQQAERFPLSVVWIAGFIWASALGVMGISIHGFLPPFVSIPAGILVMLGFVLMVPPLLEPLAGRLSRTLLEPLWPAEAELARRQVFLRPRRAVLTTAVLIVALADGIGLGHAIINTLDDVRGWYRRTLSADIALIPSDPSQSITFGIRGNSTVQHQLSDVEGIGRVKTMRLAQVRANDMPAILVSREFPAEEQLPWHFSSSKEKVIRKELDEGQVILGSMLADRSKLTVGDEIRIEHSGKSGLFRIAGVVTDYYAGGLSLFIQRDVALDKLGVNGVDMFLLSVDKGDTADLDSRLEAISAPLKLNKLSFDFLQGFLDSLMSKVVSAFWGVLVIGLIVAGFGTFNTLSMNVVEQTREIGLMRVIGMTRPQVLRTIAFQAVLLGVLGCLLGTLAGITTAYLIHLTMGGLLMREVPFTWHPMMIIGCNLLAFILLVPAALQPALRATRMDQWSALQYE